MRKFLVGAAILVALVGTADAQQADPLAVQINQDLFAASIALGHVQEKLAAYQAKAAMAEQIAIQAEARLKWMLENPAAAEWVAVAKEKAK